MENLQKLIENSTHQITDENLNKWKVIETSDLEEIMQVYHQTQLKLLSLQNVSNNEVAVCPTCGSRCEIGGKDGETKYFIPKAN